MLRSHPCKYQFSFRILPFWSLARTFPLDDLTFKLAECFAEALNTLYLAYVRSSSISIPLFFRLRRRPRIFSRFFLSKKRTRIGLELVLLGCPVLCQTSVSHSSVSTLTNIFQAVADNLSLLFGHLVDSKVPSPRVLLKIVLLLVNVFFPCRLAEYWSDSLFILFFSVS